MSRSQAPQTLQLAKPDKYGYMPIHIAVAGNAPLAMLRSLVDAFPNGLDKSDGQQNLPLHLALLCCADVDRIDFLLAAFPKAATVANGSGDLPLMLLLNSLCMAYASQRTRLVQALAFPVDTEGGADNWSCLLELHDPDAVHVATNEGAARQSHHYVPVIMGDLADAVHSATQVLARSNPLTLGGGHGGVPPSSWKRQGLKDRLGRPAREAHPCPVRGDKRGWP